MAFVPHTGDDKGTDAKAGEAAALEKEIAVQAVALRNAGVDADTVAKFIQSSIVRASGSLGITGPVGAADIPGLVTSIATALKGNGGGTDPELKELLKKLTDNATAQQTTQLTALMEANKTILEEIRNIKKGEGGEGTTKKGKIKFIKPDFTVTEIDEGEALIIEKPAADGTNSIEWEKEKNRHAEELEKIKESEKYHTGLVTTLQDTTERIGEGLAKNAERGVGGEEETAVAKKPKGDTIKCPDCKNEIPIFPETASPVECPNCGQTIYWEKKVQ